MRRMFALVVLTAALGVICKVALKPTPAARPTNVPSSGAGPHSGSPLTPLAKSEAETIAAKYSSAEPAVRGLVDRVLKEFGNTAVQIESTDGLRGLRLLDALDLQAVLLYEKHPGDFRRLREALEDDDAAAQVLLKWREYFGSKWADDVDRSILVNEIARLAPAARKLAATYPNALPLLLTEPDGIVGLARGWSGETKDLEDALGLLMFVSLEDGASGLRAAIRALESHGSLALDAFRLRGMEGFGLIAVYGPIIQAMGNGLSRQQLNDALVLLRVNSEDVDRLLRVRPPEFVASQLRHVFAVNLTKWVGGSPHGLRLIIDYGQTGEEALREAGPDAAMVAYDDWEDPTLRKLAVEAMAAHGPMALAVLDKYATDSDFRAILREHGAKVVPPVAKSDFAPEALAYLKNKPNKSWSESLGQTLMALSKESGQDTIRRIKNDGMERIAYVQKDSVKMQEFLPLYDVIHLGNVLVHGYAPTSGELTWALVDASFVVADALSLATLQPEGAAAVEAARSQLKTVAKGSSEVIAKEAAEAATESAAKAGSKEAAATLASRLSKWWAVRRAGGTYETLRRLPEAVERLGVQEIAELGRPVCAKAGIPLSVWRAFDLLKDGKRVIQAIPPQKGIKYVVAQVAQAGVGLLAIHKMEEHLRSRRPAASPALLPIPKRASEAREPSP